VRIDVRFPWYEFYVKDKWNGTEAFFAVTLTALVMAVEIPTWGPLARYIESQQWGMPIVVDVFVSAIICFFFICIVLVASGITTQGSWKMNFAVTGAAYLFLAFAGLFNIYLHELLYSGHNFLPWIVEIAGLAAFVPSEWITPNLGTLKVVVPLITFASSIASFSLLSRLCSKYSLPVLVRQSHQGILFVTTLIFLVVL
jgi:hypothetical protein